MIETWVDEGYSLRHIIIEALLSLQNDNRKGDLEEILGKVTDLLLSLNKGKLSISAEEGSLPKEFVGSIAKSVKSGMRME